MFGLVWFKPIWIKLRLNALNLSYKIEFYCNLEIFISLLSSSQVSSIQLRLNQVGLTQLGLNEDGLQREGILNLNSKSKPKIDLNYKLTRFDELAVRIFYNAANRLNLL